MAQWPPLTHWGKAAAAAPDSPAPALRHGCRPLRHLISLCWRMLSFSISVIRAFKEPVLCRLKGRHTWNFCQKLPPAGPCSMQCGVEAM